MREGEGVEAGQEGMEMTEGTLRKVWKQCPKCLGLGKIDGKKCPTCKGKMYVEETVK